MLCCAALRCAGLFCATLRYATLRYFTLRHATLYALLCYATYIYIHIYIYIYTCMSLYLYLLLRFSLKLAPELFSGRDLLRPILGLLLHGRVAAAAILVLVVVELDGVLAEAPPGLAGARAARGAGVGAGDDPWLCVSPPRRT